MSTKLLPGVTGIHPFLALAGVADVASLISEAEVKKVIDAYVECARIETERRAIKRGIRDRRRIVFDEARAGKSFADPALTDADFDRRMSGLTARVNDQAGPIPAICHAFLSRVDPLLRELFKKRDEEERQDARDWHVAFVQSSVLKAIHAHIEGGVRGMEMCNNSRVRGVVIVDAWHQYCQGMLQLKFPEFEPVPEPVAAAAA